MNKKKGHCNATHHAIGRMSLTYMEGHENKNKSRGMKILQALSANATWFCNNFFLQNYWLSLF